MSQSLIIKDLGHSFGDLIALKSVNLTLAPNRCLAIVGHNGAGKSTLFNCISGVYTPIRGTLSFGDQTLIGKRIDQIAQLGISRTFQQPQLFASLSVRQHLQLALHHVRPRRTLSLIDQYLSDCDLDALENRLPESLSFGQQKKLEIARSIANQCRLILLDEPAAGLSESEKVDLVALIKRLQKKYQLSVLIVEHQLALVEQLADSVLLLHQGRSIMQANWEEIQRSAEWRAYQKGE